MQNFIVIICLLTFELLRNYYTIRNHIPPNHAKGLALRALVIVMAGLIKFDFALMDFCLFGVCVPVPLTTIIYTLANGLIFWFPFDIILNKMRGKAWNYLGKENKGAVLDRFDIAGDLEWVIKFLLMLFGCYLLYSF